MLKVVGVYRNVMFVDVIRIIGYKVECVYYERENGLAFARPSET